MEVRGQFQAPSALPPGKDHQAGGWGWGQSCSVYGGEENNGYITSGRDKGVVKETDILYENDKYRYGSFNEVLEDDVI
jgi:hypothetical protein